MAWGISLSDPFIILIFIGDSAEPLWDSSKIRLQPTSVSRPKGWEPKPQNTGFDLMSITFLSNFLWHFFFNFTVASIKYVPHWSMACICEERKKRIITYKESNFLYFASLLDSSNYVHNKRGVLPSISRTSAAWDHYFNWKQVRAVSPLSFRLCGVDSPMSPIVTKLKYVNSSTIFHSTNLIIYIFISRLLNHAANFTPKGLQTPLLIMLNLFLWTHFGH